MATAAVLITAVVFCATVYSSYAAQGIIFLAPRSVEKNAVNKLYMSLFEIGSAGSVAVSLCNMDDDKIIAETTIDVESGETEKVVELRVPETQDYRARIWVNGSFDNYNFTEQEELYLHSVNPNVVFIQTDKPLYKPGQKVKFRILVTDRYLRPINENVPELYVEDPSGSRMAQWKNVSTSGGIRQFEFPLSEEPPLGLWKISLVQQDNRIEAQHFTAEEYVLPKFEVDVKPPSFVMADAETIPVDICARYTYGKSVQGTVKINASLESYSWSSEKFPVVESEAQIDGCLTYNVNISLIDKEFHYSYRRISVSAAVTEDGTGVQRNGSVYIQRTQNALTLEFLDDEYKQYFKPGIPYRKKIKAMKPDDTPAPNEDIEICATISRQRVLQQWWAQRKVKYCKNFTTDEEGIVLFQVPPQKTDTISLYLEAKSLKYGTTTSVPGRPRIYQAQTGTTVQPYFSPSKSYIQIENIDDALPCGTSRNVKIMYTAQEGASYTFYYQVISKGRIIEKGSKEVTYSSANNVATSMCRDSLSVNDVRILLVPSTTETGTNTTDEDIDCSAGPIGVAEISINVASALSPSIRLLVYYIRDDDETVADSCKFNVEKCFQNKVEFQFGDEVKQPGTKTSITLKASPNSLCGTKVLDKSITLLDSTDPLTKEKVFQELQKFDQQQYYQRNHCNDKYRKGGKNKMSQSMILPPRPWSSSQYADAITAIEDAGMVVLSDFKMLNRPCYKNQGSYDTGYGGFALASVGVRGGAPIAEAAPAVAFTADRNEADYNSGVRKSATSSTKSAVEIRNYFPETWLFEMETVGESGELIGKAVLPHSITQWIGSAVCINEADGLGLSDTAKITGFQAFFIDLTLPYSINRGEKVPLIISTFSYLDKCLPITRTVNVAVIADNGTMASETSETQEVCVCGGKTDTYRLMFTPDKIGSLNLTVSAESAASSTVCGDQETADVVARDALTKSLRVEAEGFKQERVSSFLFCPEDYEGSTYTNKLDLTTPQNAVEGSQRAIISLSGDIMGPAIDNLDRLVQLPTGCGEQNMVLFTPNIVALDYLTSIGKLTEGIRSKAISNLLAGYQRELKYRHPDGSFSAFGISDREGSMWLTAFVLRSFSEASKYINIDQVDIARSLNWIVQKQQVDGCFPKVGKMFSEGMKGGVGSQSSQSTAPLTAYVLAALIATGFRNESTVNGAMTCIGKDTELTPYTAALYAYSSALAGNDAETDRFLEYLDSKEIREGDEVYWRNVNGTQSLNIETAAYAVMAILKRKGDAGLSKALSVVRHMTKMRNANGGFVSTQDTVVGLQAIALFASIISQDPVDLVIEVKGGTLEKTVTIKEEDKLVVKRSRVPVVPSTVDVVAKGAGCGLLQASVRYNTLEVPKQQFFSLAITAERKDNCKKAAIHVCVQYLPEGKRSNMAVLEIKMISGFTAIKESLDQLLTDVRQYIKRYDIDNNNVVIYFDELSNENVCFVFDAEEVIPVEDTKPATAKLYDYYAKEKEESSDYRIDGSC